MNRAPDYDPDWTELLSAACTLFAIAVSFGRLDLAAQAAKLAEAVGALIMNVREQ